MDDELETHLYEKNGNTNRLRSNDTFQDNDENGGNDNADDTYHEERRRLADAHIVLKKVKCWKKSIHVAGISILLSSTIFIISYLTIHHADHHCDTGDDSCDPGALLSSHCLQAAAKMTEMKKSSSTSTSSFDEFDACTNTCTQQLCCTLPFENPSSCAGQMENMNHGADNDNSNADNNDKNTTTTTSSNACKEEYQHCNILSDYSADFAQHIDDICNVDKLNEDEQMMKICKDACSVAECCFRQGDDNCYFSGDSNSGAGGEWDVLCGIYSGCIVIHENAAMFGSGVGPVIIPSIDEDEEDHNLN